VEHESVKTATSTGRLELARAFLREIRSPEWGLAGQGLRFVIAGCLVAGEYITVTTVLHIVFALPFQVALAIGFVTSVALHFTLQRLFVWRHYESFALGIRHQAMRYLPMCGAQYGVTALTTSQLPGVVGLPVEVVYLITMLSATSINFLVFRGRIFHASREAMS
jgi:putative flippase GtrA